MEEKEIKALITLVQDQDEEVFQMIEDIILKLGIAIIPMLEQEWEKMEHDSSRQRLENLIERIQLNDVVDKLTVWKETGAKSLLEGAFLFNKFQYPYLKFEDIEKEIEHICVDAREEMNEYLANIEKVKVLNHVFYDISKISVNATNFYSTNSCYLNYLLEYKKGSPIIISALYIIVAQRLGLPIYGIDLPQNFLASFIDMFTDEVKVGEDSFPPVLFYINTLNKGGILGKKDIDFYIRQNRLTASNRCYYPCDNVQILKLMVEFQMLCYEKDGNSDKVADIIRLGKALGMDLE